MSFDLQSRQISAITVSCKEDNKHECHMSLTTMLTVPICSFVSFLDIDHRVQLFCGHKQSSWCSSLLQCPPTQRLKKIKTDLFLSSQREPSYCCVLYSPLILVHFSSVGPFFFFLFLPIFSSPPPRKTKTKNNARLSNVSFAYLGRDFCICRGGEVCVPHSTIWTSRQGPCR